MYDAKMHFSRVICRHILHMHIALINAVQTHHHRLCSTCIIIRVLIPLYLTVLHAAKLAGPVLHAAKLARAVLLKV